MTAVLVPPRGLGGEPVPGPSPHFWRSPVTLSIPWLVVASLQSLPLLPRDSPYLWLSLLFFLSLFLAMLGLCCYVWAFSSCGEWGLFFTAVHRLLIVVASLVVEHRL